MRTADSHLVFVLAVADPADADDAVAAAAAAWPGWARASAFDRAAWSERVVAGLAIREWGSPGEPGVLLWPASGGFPGCCAAAIPTTTNNTAKTRKNMRPQRVKLEVPDSIREPLK